MCISVILFGIPFDGHSCCVISSRCKKYRTTWWRFSLSTKQTYSTWWRPLRRTVLSSLVTTMTSRWTVIFVGVKQEIIKKSNGCLI